MLLLVFFMKIEKTILITNIRQLKHWDHSYKRIYFGQEFCERLIPSTGDLDQILEFVKKEDLKLTFVTPYLTDNGIKNILNLIDILEKYSCVDELVFNDWGLFNILKNSRFSLVMGRLLVKQAKDPRLYNNKIIYSKESMEELQQPYLNSSLMKFLFNNNIYRIELDNSMLGINCKGPFYETKMHCSVYFPYGYISTSRFCLTLRVLNEGELKITKSCKRECERYEFALQNDKNNIKLFLKGNTIFFLNERATNDGKIDRIIYEPCLPI